MFVNESMEPKIKKTEEEWRKDLTSEQYRILREKGTEAPFTGKHYLSEEKGMYACAACGNPLFSSDTKFESGSGWPSYYEPASKESTVLVPDDSHGMSRTEVLCGNCGSHLGHVFDDGPTSLPDGRQATGKRYCINSVCLDLQKNGKRKG